MYTAMMESIHKPIPHLCPCWSRCILPNPTRSFSRGWQRHIWAYINTNSAPKTLWNDLKLTDTKVYDTIYPPRAVGAIFYRSQINHSPCKRTAYPQVSLLLITITARKKGARIGGGGRWGGKSFYGMKEWYGTGLHVNFRITSGYSNP